MTNRTDRPVRVRHEPPGYLPGLRGRHDKRTSPPKATERRSFTGQTCQAEALDPAQLADLLRDGLESVLDLDRLDELLVVEATERAQVQADADDARRPTPGRIMTNRTDRPVRVRHEPPGYLPGLLRAGRHRIHLSQADAAAHAGICVAYLSKLENGHRCPSAVVARSLAEVLYLTDAEKALLIDSGVPGVGYDYDSTPAPRGAF